MRRRLPALLTTAVVMAASACGGSGESEGEGETTEISVGVMPLVATAPIYLGQEQGFFEDEGLELDLQSAKGGAALIPSVVSGHLDFAYSNMVSVMIAKDQGIDLRFVTNGASTSAKDPAETAVVVPEDSPIETPADLAGSSVSVNTLENIGDTSISYVVEQDGGDPSDIEFTEIAFPDAPAALANGHVDAAWVAEPFLTQALQEGNRIVTNNYPDTDPNLDIGGYFTSTETAESDPELVERFGSAMNRSLEYSQENPDEVRNIVGTYTDISEPLRAEMVLPAFKTEFDREAAALLGEAAHDYGTLENPPNLDELLP